MFVKLLLCPKRVEMRFKNVYHRSMKHADKSLFYTSAKITCVFLKGIVTGVNIELKIVSQSFKNWIFFASVLSTIEISVFVISEMFLFSFCGKEFIARTNISWRRIRRRISAGLCNYTKISYTVSILLASACWHFILKSVWKY